jgi:predicted alpha-1,6-mannanase (GH76 family)
MRKKYLYTVIGLILAVSMIFTACASSGGGAVKTRTPAQYAEFADWATQMLINNYFNEDFDVFNNQFPLNRNNQGGNNYWWKAHVVDSMIDAYERTGEQYYMDMAMLAARRNIEINDRGLLNNFIDDMQWFALALLRIWDLTQIDQYLMYVNILWEDMQTAWWDDEIGGFGWERNQMRSRAACSNAPGAILAARLYQRFGNPEDLEWAIKAYNFVKDNLKDPETGLIWDGLEVKEDGSLDINKNRFWMFTYNAGTYIGAAVELYQITGDEMYLKDAEFTSNGALSRFIIHPSLIFRESGSGDGGLFRGIFIRYWALLWEQNRDPRIREAINANVEAIRKNTGKDGLFGQSWASSASQPQDLSSQLSGHFLFEAAAKIAAID